MRRADDIWMAKQWIFFRRFVHEYIEGRACDMAGLEQGAQGRFVYEPAARAIDDSHAVLRLGEIFDRQDVFRLRRHRRMQGDDVSAGKKSVEFDLFDAEIWRASASIKAIACSAVVMELPNGVFIRITTFAVAAGISTLSTPMPARPMTRSFAAFSRILAVTFVAERIARPS